ncbi:MULTISPECIES: ATP-binding protein [unclassified Streptomyces]|uniref:ATP-binding protein n=1 Tax=unclassified Streptomyces TaxID=2593676 RepID=UPI0037F6A33B
MKQSAIKTIGAAALGAAFAAAAAGSASAAPAIPDTGAALDTVGTVVKTLPLESVAEKLPAPATEVVAVGRAAVRTVEQTAPKAAKAKAAAAPKVDAAKDPIGGLLGGLPINGLGKGLGKGGNGLNGLPL